MTERRSMSSALRVLVVEDERPAREYLVELLLAAGEVQVTAAVSTESEARQALGPGGVEVDAVFMDINLASSEIKDAGLSIARDFAKVKGAPIFVLATAFKQHAMEAFDLDVVDYLLKPFTEERVRECLARISRRCPRPAGGAPSRIVARNKKGLVFLQPNEVWAFEACERLTFVHCRGGRFDIDFSLAAVESVLGEGSLRVHRNWIVSTSHILAMERDELGSVLVVGNNLENETDCLRVPVARDKVQSVREFLLKNTAGLRR
jgi:DNA-binding LytR/AlgR family response regulator